MPGWVIAAEDELGQTIELPAEELSLGYLSFAAFLDDSTPIAIDSIPAADPPTGEVPCYDSDGVTILTTLLFSEGSLEDGYQSFVQSANAALQVAVEDGLAITVDWPNSALDFNRPTSAVRGRIEFQPGELRLIGFGATMDFRARMGVLLTLEAPIESGSAPTLSMIDSAFTFFEPPPRSQVLGRSIFTREVPPAGGGGSLSLSRSAPGYEFQVQLDCEFSFSITPTAPEFGSDGDASSIEQALVSEFAARVATPAALRTYYGNAPATEALDSLVAKFVVSHGQHVGGRVGGGFLLRRMDRRRGTMRVELRARAGAGESEAWGVVDRVVRAFAGCQLAGAAFGVPTIQHLGFDGERQIMQVDFGFEVEQAH